MPWTEVAEIPPVTFEVRDSVSVESVDRTRGDGPAAHGLFFATLAVALLPVAVATVRAASKGWLPVGDNAYFAVRARDVLTEHHPLLGTWTSASLSAGTHFNNPGPLLFDLLAVPARLGDEVGVAVGAALLNVAAIALVGLFARRRGGAVAGALGLLVASAVAWAMGSELLFDPWQPHSLLLAFLLLLVLTWSLACGDRLALPVAVGVGSLILQTHLSYVILIGALALWGAVGLGLALRRARGADPLAWRSLRGGTARAAIAAAVVLALAWSQPLVEQVTSDDEGNLSRLAGNMGAAPVTVGPVLGTRIVASVVAMPPWWFRPSFAETLEPSPTAPPVAGLEVRAPALPATSWAVVWLLVVGAALLVTVWWGRRRDDPAVWTVAVTAAVALLAGLVTASSLPVSSLGIAPHQLRWLWPLGAFAVLALALALLRGALGGTSRSAALVVLAALTAAVAAANLPASNPGAGPAGDAWAIPVLHRLNDGMAALEGEGPVVIDLRGVRFAEPYSGPVMAELQRRGIPFLVDDEGMERQMGSSRRLRGQEAQRLVIREGDATSALPGARRAVLVEGLDRDQRRELERLRSAVGTHLGTLRAVPLNERGRAAQARGRLASPLPPDVRLLLGHRLLLQLVEDDLLDREHPWHDRFARYAELQRRWDRRTVGLFLAPLDWAPS